MFRNLLRTVVRLWKLWRKDKKQKMLQKSNKIKFNLRKTLVCPKWHKIVPKIDLDIVPKIDHEIVSKNDLEIVPLIFQKFNKIKFNLRKILVCPKSHKIVPKITLEIFPKIDLEFVLKIDLKIVPKN